MKNLLSSVLVCSLFVIGCPDEDQPAQNDSTELLIAELVEQGYIVDVDDQIVSVDGEIVGIIDVNQSRRAIKECDPFGWGPEYDWLCRLTGSKGRGIAGNDGSPTSDDFIVYMEAGSTQYPEDLNSVTYYSADLYEHAVDSSVNHLAFRGLVHAWGAGWENARVNWCAIDHPLFCVQE